MSFWLILSLLIFLTLTPKPFDPIHISQIDKLFHLLAFAGFSFVFCVAYYSIKLRTIFAVSLFLGAGIEVIQYFIPNRGASLADFIADGIGIIIGISVTKVLLKELLKDKLDHNRLTNIE